MMWKRLQRPGTSADAAFEALCVQLFRLWGRRSLSGDVEFYAIWGAGGDHGVEAIFTEESGAVIGLQVKYHTPLDANILGKLNKSVDRARERYPKLRHYVVALPLNRKNLQKEKRKSKSKSIDEITRWNTWEKKVCARHQGLDVEFWGLTELEGELARPDGAHFGSFFFGDDWLGTDDIARRLLASLQSSSLKHRYIAELHTEVAFERHLRDRLADGSAADLLLAKLGSLEALADELAFEILRLPRLGTDLTGEQVVTAIGANEDLKRWRRESARVRTWLQHGLQGHLRTDNWNKATICIRRLPGVFREPSSNGATLVTGRCVEAAEQLMGSWEEFSRLLQRLSHSEAPTIVTGPAGVGKTHSLLSLAERWRDAGRPVVVLAASDYDPTAQPGVAALLSRMLERPAAEPERFLATLESAAEVAANKERRPGTRALLILDGIDERPGHIAPWWVLLSKLRVYLEAFPRVQLLVSLRSGTLSKSGRGQTSGWYVIRAQQAQVPLEEMLRRYCDRYGVSIPPELDLSGWFDTALHVRLFVQRYKGRAVPSALPRQTIAHLFADLLSEASRTFKGAGSSVCLVGLVALVGEMQAAETRDLTEAQALKAIEGAFEEQAPRAVGRAGEALDVLASWGFVAVQAGISVDPLAPAPQRVVPTFEAVVDYILARKVLERGADPWEALSDREFAMELYSALRTESDGSFEWLEAVGDVDEMPLYLRVLGDVSSELAASRRDHVAKLLIGDVTSRCAVLELLVRTMRRSEHPLGPRLVHETLKPLGVAERDLVWSGPANLKSPFDERWAGAGFGYDPLARVQLLASDPPDGPPLLLAWAATSLERSKREWARSELACWLAHTPVQAPPFVDLAAESNDPQMHEDVFAALASAAGVWGLTAPWKELESACAAFYMGLSEDAQDDCVLRAGLWALLQRGEFLGTLERQPWWSRPAPAAEYAGPAAHRHLRVHPATLPQPNDEAWARSMIVTGSDLPRYVLDKGHTPFFEGVTPEYALSEEFLSPIHGVEPSARDIALAAVDYQAYAWGWNANQFYGDPRGGRAGERIGFDIAVLRQHPQATHGSQSRVAQSSEKYTWLAVNRIAGYFADREPIKASGRLASDLSSLGAGLPMVDVPSSTAAPAVELGEPRGWDHVLPLPGGHTQFDDARRWRNEAPLPSSVEIVSWLLPDGPMGKWLIPLREFARTERRSMVDVIIRIAARVGPAKSYNPGWWGEGHGRLDTPELYVPPTLATWAPWIHDVEEDEGDEVYAGVELHFEQVDAEGVGREEHLWLPAEPLRKTLELSQVARTQNDLSGARQRASYFDRKGQHVAEYVRTGKGFKDYDEGLLVARQPILNMLKDLGCWWTIRMIREPAPRYFYQLYPKISRRFTDWRAELRPDGTISVELCDDSSPDGHDGTD